MKYVEVCNIGKVREVNQDSVFAADRDDTGLFVVADGMGGHVHGELASQYITGVLCKWWYAFHAEDYQCDFRRIMQALYQEMGRISRDIFRMYNRDGVCGSTVTLLFIYQNMYGIIYAGDSRVYVYHKHHFLQLTVDEVWEEQPELSEEEKAKYWDRYHGKLLNAIGIREDIRCRLVSGAIKKNMVFLLCSDGLYKFCPDRLIRKYMRKSRKENKLEVHCGSLLHVVQKSAAKDNISFIMIHT